MSTSLQREALKRLYGGSWASKVSKMPDHQVIALYLKFKREGKL